MLRKIEWRALPKEYGSWYTVYYVRLNRWSKNGVSFMICKPKELLKSKCLDSTTVKVHPDSCGAKKKRKTHHWKESRLAYSYGYRDWQICIDFSLSSGEKNDRNEITLFQTLENKFLLAYQGDNVRSLAKELYKVRNEIERFFRRLKRFRRIFTRYDKLDILYYSSFILFAMIIDSVVWTRHNS